MFGKEKKSWKTILLWVVIILSAIGVLSSTGRYICLPWELSFTPTDVVSSDINNGRGAIIDSSTHRVLFVDNDNKVVNVIEDTNASSNPIFYKGVVTDNDGSVYLYSYSFFKNSTYLQNETITRHTNCGSDSQVIKSFDYDLENNRTQASRIRHFAVVDDNLVLTMYDAVNNEFGYDICSKYEYSEPNTVKTIYKVPNNYIYETSVYFDSTKQYYVIDINDNLYCYDIASNTFNSADFQQFLELYKTTLYNNPCARPLKINELYDDIQNQELPILGYEPLTIARISFFWISLVVLLGLGIILLIRFVINIIKEQKFSFDKYKIPIILIISFVFAIGVTVFYTANMAKITNENNEKKLIAQSKLMSDDNSIILREILSEYSLTGTIPLDKYSTFVRGYENSALYSARCESYNQLELDKEVNGQFTDLFTTAYPTIQNSLISIDSLEYKESQYSSRSGVYVWESSTYNGNFINCTSLIFDQNNNILGAATSKTEAFVFKSSYLTNIILMVLALVMGVISISFVFYELRQFVQSFIEKHQIAKTDKKLSEVSIARPIRLLCMMSQCAESTLATIIVKDMLVGTPLEGNALAMTVPSITMTLGCFVMTLLYSPLVSRFGIKKLSIVSCALAAVSYVLCINAVLQASILLLAIGLFLANFFKEVLYLYTNALAMCCKDEEMRTNTNASLSTCSISASAIMGVLVGWTVDYIGDFTVYVVAAVPVVIMLLIVAICIPACSITEVSQQKGNKSSGLFKDTIALITNKRIILYIVGPLTVALICSCYRNLIFPMVADDAGLSSSAISNILVLSNAVIYYLTMNSRKLISSFSATTLLVVCQILMGILYTMFIFNSSIFWIVTMLMLSQYFQKMISSTGNTYYQGIALEMNISANNTSAAMSQIISVWNLLINGLIGYGITILGVIGACIASGVYSFVSGGAIFYDKTKHPKKSADK